MWTLRKTANLLRARGKYHNGLKASADRFGNREGNATRSSFTGKSIEDHVVGLAETNGSIPARGISHCHCQYPKFAELGRWFASQAGAADNGASDASENGFSELDAPADSTEDHTDPYLSEAEVHKEEVHNASPLYKTVLSCNNNELPSSLERWLADGNILTRGEVIVTFVQLRNRRMFRRLLKLSDWLEVKKPYKLTEKDYGARLDLIARILGSLKAEKYFESIPLDMRGPRAYGSLLAYYSSANNVEKTEEIFKKIKGEGFSLTAFYYNQLLLLYKRFNRKNIQVVLQMMEDDGVKPDITTYKILIDVKGRIGDIGGMEQIVENMISEDIELDNEIQALLARYYISAGLSEKAEVVLKELDNESSKDKRIVLKIVLPLYAELGKTNEVERIWKDLESFPSMFLDEYIAGIEAWGKLGQLEKAEITFEKLLNSGKVVSAKHYNSLLNVYADHHLLLKGKELVKRMSDNGCTIEPPTWDALIRLHVNAGELEKAVSILFKACNQKQLRPKYKTLVTILEKYAEKGDIANAEKIFDRVRQAGYTSSASAFESLLQAYANAHVPAYGFRERMKADNIFINGRLYSLLQRVDAFKNDTLGEILD